MENIEVSQHIHIHTVDKTRIDQIQSKIHLQVKNAMHYLLQRAEQLK